MPLITKAYTATGSGEPLPVKAGDTVAYTVTGGATATWLLERSLDGGTSWQTVDSGSGATSISRRLLNPASLNSRKVLYRSTCSAYTSGTMTTTYQEQSSLVPGKKAYSTVPIGSVAYGSFGTDTTPVSGTIYYGDVYIPVAMTLTGIGSLNGSAAATDKYIYALYDSSGNLITTSDLAGVVASGTNAFQQIAFVAPQPVLPGRYFIGVQTNGTTTRLRTIAVSTFIDVVGGSQTGTFATVANITTVPTTLTADKAPIAYVY